jgi:hypothetical protein
VLRSGGVPLDFVTDAPQLAAGSFTASRQSGKRDSSFLTLDQTMDKPALHEKND